MGIAWNGIGQWFLTLTADVDVILMNFQFHRNFQPNSNGKSFEFTSIIAIFDRTIYVTQKSIEMKTHPTWMWLIINGKKLEKKIEQSISINSTTTSSCNNYILPIWGIQYLVHAQLNIDGSIAEFRFKIEWPSEFIREKRKKKNRFSSCV